MASDRERIAYELCRAMPDLAGRGEVMALVDVVQAEARRQLADAERLEWWEQHLNYQHGTAWETGEVVLYHITGNINDREWHEVARGETLRECLDAIRKAPPSSPVEKREVPAALTCEDDFEGAPV